MYQKPSPNQQKCYINWEPFTITYSKDIPQDPIEAAIEVIDVLEILQPVFEPTSADIKLGCLNKKTRQKNSKVNPLSGGWYIRCVDLPKGADIRREGWAGKIDSPSFKVSKLSKPEMINWLRNAFNQKCPDPEVYELAWFEFKFNTVRTKIFTEELLVGKEMMRATHTRYGYYEYPLKRENGQLWVYSPVSDLFLFPTFRIKVNHIDWQEIMELNLYVGWTWWTQEGFKERDVLLKTIPQIEALGWNLEFFDNLDAFYIPREA